VYINTRLPILADYRLISRVGPAPNSGLYEISDRGLAALDNREAYNEPNVDFATLLDDAL
jgi:hypothetical protein